MARRRVNTTKYEIIQTAMKAFLEQGYSATSIRSIAKELDMNAGLLMYHFPTKEHLLAVLVEMLCDFQLKLLELEADKGVDSIMSICLEMMTVASACEENEVARDFFASTFQSELCRNYLLLNHVERAKKIFARQCEGWTDEQFAAAEIIVMGLQYSTIVSANVSVSLDMRLRGALEQILGIYNVDEPTRKAEIEAVLSMDTRRLGKRVLAEFKDFVEAESEQMPE